MDLVYIHFRDFTESYKTLANGSIQICVLMHIKFIDFGSFAAKIAKIIAPLK